LFEGFVSMLSSEFVRMLFIYVQQDKVFTIVLLKQFSSDKQTPLPSRTSE